MENNKILDARKKHKAKNLTLGLCVDCGKSSNGRWVCGECRKKYSEARRKKNEQFKLQGICQRCRNTIERTEKGIHCQSCREKVNVKNKIQNKKRYRRVKELEAEIARLKIELKAKSG